MTTTNGGPAQSAAQDQPQLTVVAQYTKDFSFENPNAPQSLSNRQEQPQIGIQINVGATPLSDTDIEVVIKVEGKAEIASTLLFRFDREIIATAVRNGGFPPLLLDPVDFVSLYRQKMAQMQPAPAPLANS